jgi:hypothetical protein
VLFEVGAVIVKAVSPIVFVGIEKLVIVGAGSWLTNVLLLLNIVSLLNASVWSVFIFDLYNAVSLAIVKLPVVLIVGI